MRELFQNSAIQLRALTQLRNVVVTSLTRNGLAIDSTTRPSVDILTRHIRHFGKFFRRLQQLSQSQFVELPMCGEMILFYWSQVDEATRGPPELISGKHFRPALSFPNFLSADTNEAVYPLRFLVQGMVLFKESLSRWTPHSRRDGMSNKNSAFYYLQLPQYIIEFIIVLVLSEEFVKNAVQLLITRFMPLNPSDLELWIADPEEWVNTEDKENDLWEYEIRVRLLYCCKAHPFELSLQPCSERVLMQLCTQYAHVVIPLLEDIFKQVAGKEVYFPLVV